MPGGTTPVLVVEDYGGITPVLKVEDDAGTIPVLKVEMIPVPRCWCGKYSKKRY